jgi:hypothetical protein
MVQPVADQDQRAATQDELAGIGAEPNLVTGGLGRRERLAVQRLQRGLDLRFVDQRRPL